MTNLMERLNLFPEDNSVRNTPLLTTVRDTLHFLKADLAESPVL